MAHVPTLDLAVVVTWLLTLAVYVAIAVIVVAIVLRITRMVH
jgi:hypothetical protein